MFLFWYRFVRPNMSGIIQNAGETIYEHIVKPNMSDYMGRIFENICQQYLYHPQVYATLPFLPGNIGRWWGTDPVKKRQEKIDIMAIQDTHALLAECKWRNAPVNQEILEQLVDKGRLFHYDKISYFLFSKTGFTEDVLKYNETDSSLYLVSFEDICDLE